MVWKTNFDSVDYGEVLRVQKSAAGAEGLALASDPQPGQVSTRPDVSRQQSGFGRGTQDMQCA